MLRRQTFSILVAWGLFFQLAIMGLHVPASIALAGLDNAPLSTQSTYRSFLICTKNGFHKGAIDENYQPVEGNIPTDLRRISGPIYQALGAQPLLVVPTAMSLRVQTITRPCRFRDAAVKDHFAPRSSLARAPPYH